MKKLLLALGMFWTGLSSAQIVSDSATATLAVGIQELPNPSVNSISNCNDTLTVVVPSGNWIYSVDVYYTLEGDPGFFGSAPNDLGVYLECLTQSAKEAQLFYGTSNTNGATENVARTGLQFANGLAAGTNLQFTLNGFVQAFFGSNCDTVDQRISNWKVVVNHGAPPSCFKPTAPVVNWVMHNRAELNWNSGGATNWQIEYGAPGFTPGTGTLVSVTSKPYVLSGLTQNTNYEFYVRDSCGVGDVSLWSAAQQFTTICNPLTFATSFSEDFDGSGWAAGTGFLNAGNTIGNCWSRSPGAAAGGNAVFSWGTGSGATGSANTGPSADVSGTGNYLYTEASGGGNQDVALITSPLIDLTTLTLPELSFSYHRYGADVGELKAQVWSQSQGWVDVWTKSALQDQSASTDPWIQVDVTLNQFANDTVLVRFRGVRGFGLTSDLAIDAMTIQEAPTCPNPSALSEIAKNTTSVTLGWSSSNASNWQISYGSPGTSASAGTKVLVNSNPGTVTGLSAGTAYDFFVRSICSVGDTSGWIGPIQVSTLCAPVTAPYSENFDGSGWLAGTGVYNAGDTLAPCWNRNPGRGSSSVFPTFWGIRATASTTPNTGPNTDHSGSGNFAYLESSAGSVGQQAFLESPFIDVSGLTIPELRFYYHMFGNSMGTLSVDVFSANSQSWTSNVFSISGQQHANGAAAYTEAVVDLSAFAGDSIVLRFVATKGNERYSDMAIDELTVDEQPACPEPDSLVVSNITTTTADLSWISGGASDWQIEYGPVGFTPGSGTLLAVNSNPYTLTGLNPAQAYEVYIRDSCGAGTLSFWEGPASFVTACGIITALPWQENFDGSQWVSGAGGANAGNQISACWSRPSANNPNFGTRTGGTFSAGTGPASDFSGSGNFLYTEASGGASGSGRITSPQIVLNASVSDPTLQFYYHMAGNSVDSLLVEISNGGSFSTVFSLAGAQQTGSNDAWKLANVPLTAYAGDTIEIRFTGVNSGFSGDISIDEVFVGNIPCPQPTNLAAANISGNSADISWTTGGATNWQIAYGAPGTAPAAATVVNVSSNPFTLSGLMNNTGYDIYVRDSCSATELSLWVGPITIQTLCGVYVAPVTENFDDTTWVPGLPGTNANNLINQCWRRPSAANPNFGTYNTTTSSGDTGPATDASGTGNFLYTEFSGVNTAFGELSSPDIAIPASFANPRVQFSYHMYGGGIDSLAVEVLSGGNATWVGGIVGQQQGAESDPWLDASFNLDAFVGDTVQIRFRGYSSFFTGDIAIDEFALIDEPCPKPGNLSATASTKNSVTLSWTTGGASNWQIEYGPAGFTQGQGTVVSAGTNPFTVTGLNASSYYDFYLRDSCSATELSQWIGPTVASTACDTALAPYFENFDVGFNPGTNPAGAQNVGSTISPCWTRDDDTLYFWGGGQGQTPTGGTGPFGDHTSGNGNYVYVESSFAAGGTTATLETPFINLDSLNQPELRFWYQMWEANGSQGKLVWEIDSGNGYLKLDSLEGSQGFAWQEIVMDIRQYAGATVKVRFEATKSNGPTAQQGDIALDDFSIIEGPSCPDPDSLLAVNRSFNSIEVNWVPGTATDWQVSWAPLSGAASLAGTSNRPYTISGLSPSTAYVICVRDSCGPGDVSNWVCDTFQTACTPFLAPFSENFDGAAWLPGTGALNTGNQIDNCWIRPSDDHPHFGTSAGPTGSAGTGPSTDASGSGNFIYTEFSATNAAFGRISSPHIIIDAALSNPELQFSYHMNGANIDSLSVKVSTSNGAFYLTSFTGAQQTAETDPFIATAANLSAYSGDTVSIIFEGYGSGFASDIAIDEFAIVDESCPVPTNFAVGTTTTSSIQLSWSSSASFSQIEYGPPGFSPGNGTRLTSTSSPLTVTGLQAGTYYDFYLRDSCGTNDSSVWVGPLQGVTLCGVITAPYAENFDAGFDEGNGAVNLGSTISPCWSRNRDSLYHWGGGTGVTPSGGTGPGADHTSGAGSYVYVEATGGAGGDTAFLESPDIDLSALTTPELRFWLHMFSQQSNPFFRVEILSNSNWVLLDSLSGSQGNFWSERIYDLSAYSGQTIRLRFYTIKAGGAASFQGDVAIDDLTIDDVPPCSVFFLPYNENFDANHWAEGSGALNNGDVIDACWSRLTTNQQMWTTGSATTPSANTGPNTDVSGSGNYIYTEASRGAGSSWINTPRVFIDTSDQNPHLWFSYHMYGASITSLEVQVNDGSGWSASLLTLTGQQQTAGNLPWLRDSVDLSAYAGDTIEIRFVGQATNFTGDIAIDEVMVDEYIFPCSTPTNITFANATSTSVDVSWTSTGGGTSILSYYDVAAGAGSAASISPVSSPYTLSGLLPNTNYVISVRDSCSATNISASLSDTTTTLPCDTVNAAFSWNANFLNVNFSSAGTANADSLIWDFGDGNSSNVTNPNHLYAAAGTYNVQLIALNDCGNGDTLMQQVLVCDTLIAAFTVSTNADSLYYDGAPSSGAIGHFWDFGDGNVSMTMNGSHKYSQTGSYRVTLAVYNSCGDTAFVDTLLSVCGAPKAYWSYTILSPINSGMRVQFDGSASINAVSYNWNFGDGNTGTGINPIHNYATPSLSYVVTLTVTNSCGDVDIHSFTMFEISVPELEAESSIKLYPVPAAAFLTLEWDEQAVSLHTVELMDASGRAVKSWSLSENSGELVMDIGSLTAGFYYLQIHSNTGILRRNILKQ